MTKDVDGKIDEDFLQLSGHLERMENDRIAKRVYVGECTSSCSVDKLRKKWIDSVKLCFLKNRGLDVSQAKRMVHDRSV